MANNIIPNVNPGEIVGSTPTFPPNAVVKGDFLYLRDANGNQISGRTVSDGDEITVLDIGYSKQLVLVQYPTGSGYRQGYVSNATSIIKYKDDYSWVNGSTPEAVYDLDKTTQIGTLDPRERAVVLYKVDGMTAVAYDTGKGKLTKSGLVHYEGSGSSTGGGSFNGVAPGEVVPGGFTYDNNAQVVGDELYLRDRNGNIIPGRSVSDGDNITVLDVSYSKQLALVQYPAGKVVRQGYVTNATNLIRYFKQGEWLNGSTTEPVLDENGGSLGSLSPYEAATPLYKKNGMIHVVYDTSKGPNTKSGYVKFEGLAQLPDTSIQIPSVSHSQATVEVYGTSGKGRPLKVYKIGNGSKVLFAGFAIHGWEDRWDNDGLALVNIANSLISKIGDYKAQNGLHGWTVYIAPCMNPDGVIVRGTNNGPGRCAVKSRIDMNRCFPRGFTAQYNSRNYTGPNPLGAQEAVALKEFIEKINRTADELVVIDGHGWLGCTYGDSSIAQYFTKQFGFSHNGPSGGGYFSYWAQGLPRTRGLLLEYPDTYSYGEVISRNYIGKTFNAIINILKNNPNGGSVDSGNSGNGGSTSSEGSSSSADISYTATGEVINVQSFLNVRKGPGTNYDSIGQLHQGDKVNIVAKNGIWYKISSPIAGYVHEDFIKIKDASNSSEDKKSPSMEDFIEVLTEIYNIVESNYKSYSIKEKNEIVLDYLRKEEYSKRKGGLNGQVWEALFSPSKYEWLEGETMKVDSKLKEDYDDYTKNNNKIGKAKIEVPHLAATTLGYSKNNLQLSILPRYWTGWGGDFATLVGELINKRLTDEDGLYEKAMELLGGNSTFSDSDFYSDIDAIYFAKNLNTAPIYKLVKSYYNGLEYKRKELIINSIGGNLKNSLEDRIKDKFEGREGIGYSYDSGLIPILRGFGLRHFINKEANGVEYSPQTLENAITAVSRAFANKIETLQNGFLK
ncbi:TPA: SH3 domain-containing protein [Clostridium perfringens]|nr:SH3 domain-containing protein [Clostridium perfringens]HAT4347189.1 SH3 domain-containing protein [Clostridium perfringens]